MLKLLKTEIIQFVSAESAKLILVDYDNIKELHRNRILSWKPNKLQEEDDSKFCKSTVVIKNKNNKRTKNNNGAQANTSYANLRRPPRQTLINITEILRMLLKYYLYQHDQLLLM